MASGDIVYRRMTSDDLDAAADIVCTVFPEQEPLFNCFATDRINDGTVWLNSVARTCLDDGLSLVAVDSRTDQIVGLRVTAIVHKGIPDVLNFSKTDPRTRAAAQIYDAVQQLYTGIDIFEKYNVEQFVSFRGLLVKRSHQNMGIGSKLVKKTLELVKKKGIKLVVTEASNQYSQAIFLKNGFVPVNSIRYENLVVDGKKVEMTEAFKFHKKILLLVQTLNEDTTKI